MLDAIHKTFLVGVGLAEMTKDKINEHARELVKKGKLSQKEGRDLTEKMLKKAEQTGKDLQKQVEKRVEQALHKLQVASKKDLDKLAARIRKLEAAKSKK